MVQFGLIGIGAGAAAALLFASVTSGSLLSILLFYLAPLPIMIAGLGWSHWAALTAALTGGLALALVFGSMFFFAFLAGAGLPAWWLTYLAMLARPAGAATNGSGAASLEWYPPGRLVVWAAALATLSVTVAILNFGTDADTFRRAFHDMLAMMLRLATNTPKDAPLVISGVSDVERFINGYVAVLPPAAAVLTTVIHLLNLWLSGRIVKFSGRLTRPWPKLSTIAFPRPLAAALVIAVGLSFSDSLVGIVAGVLSSSLLMAYGVLGFAVLHAITQGISNRAFVLGSVYAAVIVIGLPVLALSLLGLIETIFDVRARVARGRGPPPALQK
jgi:hypothetical protein